MQRGQSAGQGLQCDCSYFTTLPAIFKIVQVISSLVAFICPQNLTILDCGGCIEWFRTAAMTGLLFSVVFLVVYLLHIHDKFAKIPWLKIDLIGCIFWTIFDGATATKFAVTLNWCRRYGNCSSIHGFTGAAASGISFGYVAMIAYGCDVGLKLLRIMRGS